MRILFIGPLPEPTTGQSLACKVLLEALKPFHRIDVVNLAKKELVSGANSISRIFVILAGLVKIAVRRHKADVVYLTISQSLAGNLKDIATYSLLLGKLNRTVVHLHGGSIKREIFDKYPLLRAVNKLFLRRVSRIVVLGESHRSIFEGMIDDAKIRVVKNFAEDFLFLSQEDIRQKFASGDKPIHILFLSNLIAGKGHDVLLDAYALLPEDLRSGLIVDFAGSFESDLARVKFCTHISKLSDVIYHGSVRGEEKRKLLHTAHVFCLPTSLSEGQPISILEAYAAGCAVITTACGGIPDIFAPDVNGFGIEASSQESLMHAIVRAASDRSRLFAFATENHRLAQGEYRSVEYTRDMIEILEDAESSSGSRRQH